MNRRTLLWLALFPGLAQAHSFKAGDIAIGHAWAMPSQQTEAQVFFPLLNSGSKAETSFELLQGKPFPMRPTASHLRLIGLRKPLVAGDKFSLILNFEFAGEVEIEAHIEEKPSD
jgi:periplasmic copper chaperone A